MHDRNIALLAKHGWKLLNEDQSRWIQIIKTKYMSGCTVIEAPHIKYHRPSTTWWALSAGLQVLTDGLIWRVGNGRATNFLLDLWCPLGRLINYISPLSNAVNTNVGVSDFMVPTGWNIDLLSNILPEHVGRSILPLRIARESKVTDRPIWLFTNSGMFIVSSITQAAQLHTNQWP